MQPYNHKKKINHNIMDRELKNQRISDDVFMKERAEVLQQWPTGKDISSRRTDNIDVYGESVK